ncbi:MAG TPA: hypothetical protein VK176_11310 [Phycisphaerales bacterium]|nr:hypothetical protein [Phycisphaerales bacterium]
MNSTFDTSRVRRFIAAGALVCTCLGMTACSASSNAAGCSPCGHPLAEPGYPWPGTETVTRIECQHGPLQN